MFGSTFGSTKGGLCRLLQLQRGAWGRSGLHTCGRAMGVDGEAAQPQRRRKKTPPSHDRPFIDRLRLFVSGGDGGSGCSSFRKSRHSSQRHADGGNGGRGGDVILKATASMRHLAGVTQHQRGERGGNGSSKWKLGSRGADKIVAVPIGTVVRLLGGEIPSVSQISQTVDFQQAERKGNVSQGASLGGASDEVLGLTGKFHLQGNGELREGCVREAEGEEVVVLTEGIEGGRWESEGEEEVGGVSQNPKVVNSSQYSDKFESSIFEDPEKEESSKGSWNLKEARFGDGKTEGDEGEREEGDEDEREEKREEDEDKEWKEKEREGEEEGEGEGEEENNHNRFIASESDERNGSKRLQNDIVIADLAEEGQTLTVAVGGEGGRGNVSFNRKKLSKGKLLPSRDHEPGNSGTSAVLQLELKVIADIGLVGAPNAGKSTLLSALSNAEPRVGSYAFTTLTPQLGTVTYPDFYALSVADIPGLIEGAHVNRGLGFDFLRHIERTRAFAYVLDMAPPVGEMGPCERLKGLEFELEMYQKGMAGRPAVVVANKMDEKEAEGNLRELEREVGARFRVFPVCAVLGEGVEELREGLRELLAQRR